MSTDIKPAKKTQVTLRNGSRVYAEWRGGSYVDLSFYDSISGVTTGAVEVINVRNYSKGTLDERILEPGTRGLHRIVSEWVKETRKGWPSFVQDYVRNS